MKKRVLGHQISREISEEEAGNVGGSGLTWFEYTYCWNDSEEGQVLDDFVWLDWS